MTIASTSREQIVSSSRVRLGAVSLALSGILFVLYPLLRPFSDEASLQGAQAFASTAWILAHLLGVLGFILIALGLLGLSSALQHTAAQRLASLALVLTWIGVGLILPYYGAEMFGLRALPATVFRDSTHPSGSRPPGRSRMPLGRRESVHSPESAVAALASPDPQVGQAKGG